MEFENNVYFWQKVDTLVAGCNLQIKWHKGDKHPDIPNEVFPLDSGQLVMDDTELTQCYVGSGSKKKVTGCVVICDILYKQFREVLLIGCTGEEEETMLHFMSKFEHKKCVYFKRSHHVPSWESNKDDE